GSPLSRGRQATSCESRSSGELGSGRKFASADLGAVGLYARDLEAAVGADHREAVGLDRDDLSHLAGDAFRVLPGERLGVEDFQGLAGERRPGAGRGIAAADQAVDLLPRLAPVDAGIVGAAAAFIGGL